MPPPFPGRGGRRAFRSVADGAARRAPASNARCARYTAGGFRVARLYQQHGFSSLTQTQK